MPEDKSALACSKYIPSDLPRHTTTQCLYSTQHSVNNLSHNKHLSILKALI